MSRTRAMVVRDEARRLLSLPNPQMAVAERLAYHQLLLDEALARLSHLEAMFKTTDPEPWPPTTPEADARMTARPPLLLAALILVAAALVTVLALIAFSEQPPPACSDAYDPACATIYEGEG